MWLQTKRTSVLAACAVALEACTVAAASVYGPNGCVSLSLSPASSCVIKTNCEGLDLSHFEFSFDCTTPKNELQRHSFGLGGFDPVEEFDTDVKCTQCMPPGTPHNKAAAAPTHSFALQSAGGGSSSAAGATVAQAAEAAAAPVKYGPKKCVSTYRSSSGHCVMQTACSKANITNYDFGLICVDKAGSPTRHLFGKNSFDPDETFDTLIACDQCMGLDDIPDDIALTGQVASLSKDITGLKSLMSNITKDVELLNAKVFPTAAPAPSPPAQGLLHHASSKRTLRKGHKTEHHDVRFSAKKTQKTNTLAAAEGVEHETPVAARLGQYGLVHKQRLRQRQRRHRASQHHAAAAEEDQDEQASEEDGEAQNSEEPHPAAKSRGSRHKRHEEDQDEEAATEDQDAVTDEADGDDAESQGTSLQPEVAVSQVSSDAEATSSDEDAGQEQVGDNDAAAEADGDGATNAVATDGDESSSDSAEVSATTDAGEEEQQAPATSDSGDVDEDSGN